MATETLLVTGNGHANQWTASAGANWECVDDDNADTSYVYTNTVGGVDWYELNDPVAIGAGDTINSVTIYAKCRSVAQTPSLAIGSYVNPDAAWGGNQAVTTSYVAYSQLFNNAPDAGAWTLTDLQNLRAGIQYTVGLAAIRCTYVYAVVDYTAAPAATNLQFVAMY